MAKWKFLGGQTENEFMEEARLNFHRGLDADRLDRDEARHDVKFYAGGDNQWDQQSLELRRPADQSKPKRPVLTWNRLHGPVYQVCNDGRQNKPSIHVSQGDGGDAPTEEYCELSASLHRPQECHRVRGLCGGFSFSPTLPTSVVGVKASH